MGDRRTLARLRAELAGDRDAIRQGIALAESLGDPAIWRILLEGLAVDGQIRWTPDSELARRVQTPHRFWAATGLLRASGRLDGVQRLDLDPRERRPASGDLEFLAGLPALESLTIRDGSQLRNLDALADLPALRELSIWNASELRDIGGLASASRLERLEIRNSYNLSDFRPLAALSGLRHLSLGPCRGRDLAPLTGRVALESLKVLAMGPRDVQVIAGQTGLRVLQLSGGHCEDFSALAALTGLERLELTRLQALRDVSFLAGMRRLTWLDLHEVAALSDLSPLAGCAALEALDLTRTAVEDLSPLAGLKRLTRLSLGCTRVRDLSPLAGLRRLEILELFGTEVGDLSPLSGATSLRVLDLCSCEQVTDLSPLAGSSGLRRIWLRDAGASDLSPLAGLVGLFEEVELNDNADLTFIRSDPIRGVSRDGRLSGPELAAALQALPMLPADHPLRRAALLDLDRCRALRAAPPMSGLPALTRVRFVGCPALEDISSLAEVPSLVHLDLGGAASLTDLSPLVALPALTHVGLGGCDAVRPRPGRKELVGRPAVAAYQRKLARALKRNKQRTPAQDALLAAAQSAGLLSAATAQRQREDATSLDGIRRLLASPHLSDAIQGVALLGALNDPGILSEFLEGIHLWYHRVRIDYAATRRPHLRRLARRQWIAWAMLRLSGALDGEARLIHDVRSTKQALPDLSPFRDLPALEELTLFMVAAQDLSPLGTLPGLRRLELQDCMRLTDLTPIAGLTELESLNLRGCAQLRDVSLLPSFPALQSLDLRRCAGLPSALQKNLTDPAKVRAFVAGL